MGAFDRRLADRTRTSHGPLPEFHSLLPLLTRSDSVEAGQHYGFGRNAKPQEVSRRSKMLIQLKAEFIVPFLEQVLREYGSRTSISKGKKKGADSFFFLRIWNQFMKRNAILKLGKTCGEKSTTLSWGCVRKLGVRTKQHRYLIASGKMDAKLGKIHPIRVFE